MVLTAHGQVHVEDWPKVRMEIAGMDAKGDPLADLTADAMTVRENKKPVKVDVLERAAGPMSVCVVVDMSGSMYARLPLLRSTVQRFLDHLPEEDEVCVVDFGFKVYMPQKFTLDRSKAIATLAPLHAWGGTALHDALILTAAYMRKSAKETSQAIVVFSDGADNSSQISERQFWQDIAVPGTPPVHIVRIPTAESLWDDREDAREAQEFSQRLGGFTFSPHKNVDLMTSVDRLNAVLKSRYVLAYESEDGRKDGRKRRVDLELDKMHQKAKDVIRAPEGYYAPSQ